MIGERQPSSTEGPWTLRCDGAVEHPQQWSLEELQAFDLTRLELDIHCVTRWSKLDAVFFGVTLATLVEQLAPHADARFVSFISRSSRGHSSSLPLEDALQLNTLIALRYGDAPLPLGHGGPIRNIVPGRYFYKSVKWLERIEFLTEDRLGMWEAESGYHNTADPWLEQRYMAPTLDKREAAALIRSRDFSGRDLRSIDCTDRDLSGLQADSARLRDANFSKAQLSGASFVSANLSNAHFRDANLRGANFRDADVEGADFSGADLRDADFTNASMIGASFFNAQSRATIDESTCLPEQVIQPLFPEQLEYVIRHRKTPPA